MLLKNTGMKDSGFMGVTITSASLVGAAANGPSRRKRADDVTTETEATFAGDASAEDVDAAVDESTDPSVVSGGEAVCEISFPD